MGVIEVTEVSKDLSRRYTRDVPDDFQGFVSLVQGYVANKGGGKPKLSFRAYQVRFVI